MRLLFAVYFIVNVLALLIVLVRARQQSCTANHCGEISKDIKTLHTEVKNLVALVKALCVRSLQVPFRIISMGSSFNFVIFPMFSMRSDFKIALLSSSQSIPSLLARSSTTQESKYKVNCFFVCAEKIFGEFLNGNFSYLNIYILLWKLLPRASFLQMAVRIIVRMFVIYLERY